MQEIQTPILNSDSDAPGSTDKVSKAKGTFGGWMFNVLVGSIVGLVGLTIGVFYWAAGRFDSGFSDGKRSGEIICAGKDKTIEKYEILISAQSIAIDSLKARNLEIQKQNITLQYGASLLEKDSYGRVFIQPKKRRK
jgi:hypothetical protein